MLEKVIRDHEILAVRRHLRQRLSIVNEIGRLQRLTAQLWVVGKQVLQRQAVDVGDRTPVRHLQLSLKRSHLQAGTAQESRRQFLAGIALGGGSGHDKSEEISAGVRAGAVALTDAHRVPRQSSGYQFGTGS